MRRLATMTLTAGVFLAPLAARATEDFPRGAIVDRVSCAADPRETYALYLPSALAPGRGWPIVYLFDPSARGRRAVETFQKAAETYGFLLAGSNNSQNGPIAVSLAAAQAVWRDTRQRFPIDDRRVYTAGFSGGARVASLIGERLAGSVAGVIGCGAGFPPDVSPSRGTRFAYFGLVGDGDFNYRELRSLDETLEKLKLPHRLEVFEGPHQWPPEPFPADALAWMRLREMAAGIARDDVLAGAIFERRLTRAKEPEARGEILEAHREYSSIARDFAPLRDVSAAAARAAELEKDGRWKKLLAAEEKAMAVETAMQERLDQALESLRVSPQLPPVGGALAQLRVSELKKQAQSADVRESRSAQRLLASLLGRTSYYFSQDAIEKKDYNRAVFFLSVAAEIRPESPQVWYNRACAWARAGNRKKALEDLGTAVERGFRDRGLIETDPDLASLREEERFRQILHDLSAPIGSTAKP